MRINSLPSLREIRSQLVLTTDAPNRMAVSRASRDETLIRITRGVYLPSCLLEGYPLWFQRTIVRGSRICALAVRRSNCVLTGECAGWVLELPVCADRGPIVAYVPRHSGIRSLSFDPVRLGSKAVMPSELACLIRSTVVPERQSADGFTVPCASRVLIDCARMSTRERAFTVTCAGMARLASFSRFDQVASRERGEECRAELLQELGSLPPSTRGASQARWSISHADVGCESPGESRVLYALILARIGGITTQAEVHCGGHTFYVDIAIADLKIAIEFDGRVKYGDSVDEVHESIEAEQHRARLLQLSGWLVIRVRWSDLRHIDEVVAQVLVAIRQRCHLRARS